ncbi:DUF664 domain-containing protein [Cellulomonas sp. APG4]|uniref:DinB family protein n=1 Tax=Cellulomonas sp. APG4 TaxID=1538656 RepID=UPI00137B1A3D|nr:DUF664 domain-containing protein [Cellulomonas sp. APG4]
MHPDELLLFCDRALDGMVAIVEHLGDDLANARPELPGANSPFAILTHCVGVIDAWAGHRVAGRPLERDRDAEFRATGRVEDLLAKVAAARTRLHDDAHGATFEEPLRHETGHALEHHIATQGAALLHVLEELAQHHGQMELTRDLLRTQVGTGA